MGSSKNSQTIVVPSVGQHHRLLAITMSCHAYYFATLLFLLLLLAGKQTVVKRYVEGTDVDNGTS